MVNEVYELNNVPIKLYLLCNPIHINRTHYYENIDSESEFEDMIGESYNPNALNIHFVWDNYRNDIFNSWNGRATFPNYYPNPYSLGIRTNRDVIGNDREAQKEFVSSLVHEIGHTLGLAHTHQGGQLGSTNPDNGSVNRCEQEYVDRGKILEAACSQFTTSPFLAAEYNGDALMDTPADPNLAKRWVTDNCNYAPTTGGNSISTPKDRDGVTWQPSGINFMSYTKDKCRIREGSITTLQKGVMFWYLENHLRSNFGSPPYDPNPIVHNDAEIDEYENDNTREVANFVNLSRLTRQHHTLHQNLGELTITEGICDEDWLTFDVAYARKVIVVTRPVEGKPNVDTFLELFRYQANANGIFNLVPVAQDNDNSPYGTGYSRIIENNLSAGKYYVRVTSRSSSLGHYVIGIFPERENWGSGGSGGGIGNGNGDGGVDISIGTPNGAGGDIDGNGTVDYLCDDAQIAVTGLDLSDPNWTIDYSVNNSIATISSTGLLQANGYFGDIVITAMISYNGALIANAVQSVWIGKPERPTLVVSDIRGVGNQICYGEEIYLSAANSSRGFATGYKWQLYKNGVKVFETTTPTPDFVIDRLVTIPVGTYVAYVSACNDCGCNPSLAVGLEVLPRTDPNCGRRLEKIQANSMIKNEISIYPNPVSNQLTIKLPSVYNENLIQVELYNSIGQLVLSKSYTETTIEFSVSSFPKGLYILKIQNGEEMKTEKIIIE